MGHGHEHKTEEEYRECNERTIFRRIAENTKRLLDARREMMMGLLKGDALDVLQEKVQDCIKRLELDVDLAKQAGLLEC